MLQAFISYGQTEYSITWMCFTCRNVKQQHWLQWLGTFWV